MQPRQFAALHGMQRNPARSWLSRPLADLLCTRPVTTPLRNTPHAPAGHTPDAKVDPTTQASGGATGELCLPISAGARFARMHIWIIALTMWLSRFSEEHRVRWSIHQFSAPASAADAKQQRRPAKCQLNSNGVLKINQLLQMFTRNGPYSPHDFRSPLPPPERVRSLWHFSKIQVQLNNINKLYWTR